MFPSRTLATTALALALAHAGAAVAEDAHTVVQSGRAFHPLEVTIGRGDTLLFSNQDEFIHQVFVKSDAMTFDSDEQPPGQTVAVKFPVSGTFAVRCHIHPKMALTVHVK